MTDKAKLRLQMQNEPKTLPNESFNYSSPTVDTSTVASYRSEYRYDSATKRRTASCMFVPIKGNEMNSSMKTSRLAVIPNLNTLFNCIESNEPSSRNFIEHSLHPDYFTGEDDDDFEEFFLVPPAQSRENYFCDHSQEVLSRPVSDTLNNSRVDSVLPATHTCHGVDYRDHSSDNHNEVTVPLTPNTTLRVRQKYTFLKPRF